MKLFLHIGSQKTGSTSIQKFLLLNKSILQSQGFYVPDYLGGSNHRHAVFLAEDINKREDGFVVSQGLQGNIEKKRSFKENLLNRMRSDCSNNNHKCWIISSEFFQSCLCTYEELRTLRSILHSLFSEISIICYIRDPLSTALSTWSTYIMSGGVANKLHKPNTIYHNNCDHESLVRRWSDVFNNEQIDIRHFSRKRLICNDVARDFCSAIGIYVNEDFKMPNESNKSLSYKGILTLSYINIKIKNMNIDRKSRHDLGQLIQSTFKDYPRYTPTKEEVISYHNAYKDSYRWVSNNYFGYYESIMLVHLDKANTRNNNDYKCELSKAEKAYIDLIVNLWIKNCSRKELNIKF